MLLHLQLLLTKAQDENGMKTYLNAGEIDILKNEVKDKLTYKL